jgi:2-methylcitrate dehydratase PrpD
VARAYLAGAGVMARLGAALGWRHYSAGWHATCTAGAPAAAAAASAAFGLDADEIAAAIALALPGAGGVQRAFGTEGKALQVANAAEVGVRAAELVRAGAGADPLALDDWMRLVDGDPGALVLDGPAIPGGLAIKLFPCCYALQRPISAVLELGPLAAEEVRTVRVRTPASALRPLIHRRPTTGLEGKFSLEYGIAATILDGRPGLESFTDAAVNRAQAQQLLELVEVETTHHGDGLVTGVVQIELELDNGETRENQLTSTPNEEELEAKLAACAPDGLGELSWETAAGLLRERL